MAAVGDNIRTLHSRLAERSTDCTLEWNSGGHFKDADLRTARAFLFFAMLFCGEKAWYTESDNSEFMKSEALILLCGMN